MRLSLITPAKSLNKAYLRQSVQRDHIELFKKNLITLFDRIRADEHEEHLKNIVADFLKDTWYKPAFEINTSKRTDLVIHNGKSSDDTIGVIIETKKPSNKTEMISPDRPNAKALHELLHYYMQERYIRDKKEIKHLIVCNIYEWYVFDAADFERFFFNSQKLVKSYKDRNDGLLVSTNTDWFYQEIARPFIEKELAELPCTCFDLRDFERIARNPDKVDDRKLISLYKLLSPPHLLKQPFANDSNSLNKEFYNELLHIIGLEEVKEKGKKLIRRKAPEARQEGSLLENTCNFLKTRGRLANSPIPNNTAPTRRSGCLVSPWSSASPGSTASYSSSSWKDSSSPTTRETATAPSSTAAASPTSTNWTSCSSRCWQCARMNGANRSGPNSAASPNRDDCRPQEEVGDSGKLPEVLSEAQKLDKIHNLLNSLARKRGKIRNVGSRRFSQWVLAETGSMKR